MRQTANTLAEYLTAKYEGPSNFSISGLNSPEKALSDELIFFLDSRYKTKTQHSQAQVILTTLPLSQALSPHQSALIVDDVRVAWNQLLQLFHPESQPEYLIHPSAIIGENCQLDSNVSLGAYSVIGNGSEIQEGTQIQSHVVLGQHVKIGKHCVIHPHVTLYNGVTLGDHVIVHSGTRIGSDGYSYYFKSGQHHKIPQVGRVIIENHVEIGANVCIDRGAIGDTHIGQGTKIDNLVQVGHNVKVGAHNLLVSQVGISGSTELGEYVTLAGQVGVAGHLKIGSRVIAAGKSGITKDIPSGQKIAGFPAQNQKDELKTLMALRRLPEFLKWWRAQKKK